MVFQVENSLVLQPLDQTHDNLMAQAHVVGIDMLHQETVRNLDLDALIRLTRTIHVTATQMFFWSSCTYSAKFMSFCIAMLNKAVYNTTCMHRQHTI